MLLWGLEEQMGGECIWTGKVMCSARALGAFFSVPKLTVLVFYLCRRNALVCSHDHLTLFLTLVSGLEFIRFDLDLVRIRVLSPWLC